MLEIVRLDWLITHGMSVICTYASSILIQLLVQLRLRNKFHEIWNSHVLKDGKRSSRGTFNLSRLVQISLTMPGLTTIESILTADI